MFFAVAWKMEWGSGYSTSLNKFNHFYIADIKNHLIQIHERQKTEWGNQFTWLIAFEEASFFFFFKHDNGFGPWKEQLCENVKKKIP